MNCHRLPAFVVISLLSLSASAQTAAKLVDVIPKSFSNETNQESEPSLTINPANPLEIVASAFTPRINYCDPKFAPVFYTTNGGISWDLKCWLPTATWTADATLRFSRSGKLYAGILRQPDLWFLVVRGSIDTDQSLAPILTKQPPDAKHIIDQPYLETNLNGPDEVFVGDNDNTVSNPDGAPTASLHQSYNSGDPSPIFDSGKVDKRTSWFDLPPIRPATHKDGTVYVAFMSIHGYDENTKQMIGDVVVARGRRDPNDHKLSLEELKDPSDSLVGNRVVKDIRFPYDSDEVPCCLGQQRYQASLSIAVDPNNSAEVYLAWADLVNGTYTLHVRSSNDSGASWDSADKWTVSSATNPALAVDEGGVVGFLFQQLLVEKDSQKWTTTLVRSGAKDLTLSKAPATEPTRDFHPYIGDYLELHAVGKNFYGIFSANNTPDKSYFPAIEPTFLRNHDWDHHQILGLDGKTARAVSIDPFFFEVPDSDTSSPTAAATSPRDGMKAELGP